MLEEIKVIILAAGKSTRMQSDEPKALTMLKGKPFLAHILSTIESLNLPHKPIIVVGHRKERIKEILGNDHEYVEQTEQLGTGHAVKTVKGSVNSEHKTIIILSTDQPLVSKKTLEQIISNHQETNSVITLATITVPDFEEWRVGLRHFGRIVRGDDRKVLNITEYKDATEKEKMIKELNPAVYAFDSDWLWENIGLLKNENKKSEYYLTDLIKIASDQNRKIETVPMASLVEGLQPNTQEELRALEKITV